MAGRERERERDLVILRSRVIRPLVFVWLLVAPLRALLDVPGLTELRWGEGGGGIRVRHFIRTAAECAALCRSDSFLQASAC